MSVLRIALMPSAYAPAVGGVEVLTARLAHQLLDRGHAVEVWAPRHPGDDLPVEDIIDGIRVRRFVFALPRAAPLALAGLPLRAARTFGELRRAVTEYRPTHLHVQCFSGNGLYATALSRALGVPLVVTLQGETVMDDRDIYDRSTTLRAALRLGLRQASQVTGCSQFTLDDAIRRFSLDPAKSTVVFNGVDPQETLPTPVDLPYERYVLGLGRVVHKKGFDLLIRAFARVAERHPDVGLVIAGSGPETGPLRDLVRASGLSERVHFPGGLDRGQVAAVMENAQAFVMPSRVEPFGIVALEAWRAGVPAVVTSRGGASEFVTDGRTGLVIDPEDTHSLAQALNELLADDAFRHALTIQARRSLPDFGWDAITSQYETLYERVRQHPARPRPRSGAAAPDPRQPVIPEQARHTMRPLRIGMISNYLPSGSKIGVGYQVHAFANALVSRGHDVTVFSACPPSEGANYRTVQLPSSHRWRTFAFARTLVRWDLSGFDVLHAHGDDYWLWGRRAPVHVRTLHGSCLEEAIRIPGVREKVRMAALGLSELASSVMTDLPVAVSPQTSRWMPWVRSVIPNGVDDTVFRPREAERSDVPMILFVGTYGNRKRGRLLQEAFQREIRPQIPDARLVMVCSDAPECPGVTVTGRISEEELVHWYQRSWVFCLPSSYEGFGIPYVEALLSGLRVVATPNPGARYVLAGCPSASLVDESLLGAALFRHLADPDSRRVSLASVEHGRMFTMQRVVRSYEELYASRLPSTREADPTVISLRTDGEALHVPEPDQPHMTEGRPWR